MIVLVVIFMISVSLSSSYISLSSSLRSSLSSSLRSSSSSSLRSSFRLYSSNQRITIKETIWKPLETGVDICDLEICIDGDLVNYEKVPLSVLLDGVLDEPLRLSSSSELPSVLYNRYYGLRHGQSEANIAGIISSEIVTGSTIHGLTPLGIDQARQAAMPLLDVLDYKKNGFNNLVMISSNFTRARETAQECLDEMKRITSSSSSSSGKLY